VPPSLSSLVLRYIRERELLRAGDRVCVAVSGGADSVALLRLLLELRAEVGIVLLVVHINHRLRGADSDADEAFVEELARQHNLDFFAGQQRVAEHPLSRKLGLEGAARELRYRFFAEIAAQQRADATATGHTLDDQAETVLLKFLRGAGTRGLAGIFPSVRVRPRAQQVDHDPAPEIPPDFELRIVRPLLAVSRAEIEAYLESLGQPWREDESNRDPRFTRNRIRHELLPLLTHDYNPNLRNLLSDTAEVARVEEDYWQILVERELAGRIQGAEAPKNLIAPCGTPERLPFQKAATPAIARLNLTSFTSLPLALRRRLLKSFAESHGIAIDFEHVEKLRRCASGEKLRTKLPGAWLAERKGDQLVLCTAFAPPAPPASYEYLLIIPGKVHLPEVGAYLQATLLSEQAAQQESDPDSLLVASLLGSEVTVRNWHSGDRFWPVHRGCEEKLKRLFSEKRIPAQQRPTWPIVLRGAEILWVLALPVAQSYAWKGQGEAVKIELHSRRPAVAASFLSDVPPKPVDFC
jgi:tRNA(Ile)-lysidine synthase